MNREQAILELKEIQLSNLDEEMNHARADEILTDLLISLGYEDVVQAYEQVQPKWYA